MKLNGNQSTILVHAQTNEISSFYEALNGRSIESEIGDTLVELVGLGGQDLREGFEARLKEINVEMGGFDKVRGGFSRVNLEKEKVGIKEQKKARNDAEPTPKSVDRHDAGYEDKLNREAEKVADTKSCSQSWVLETGIKVFTQYRWLEEYMGTAGVNEVNYGSIQTSFGGFVPSVIKETTISSKEKGLKHEDLSLINKWAEQSLLLAQPLIHSKGPLTDTKPTAKSVKPLDPKPLKITWVRKARNIIESPSETIMLDIEKGWRPTLSEDSRPLKRQAVINEEAFNLIPTAVAGDQPRRSP